MGASAFGIDPKVLEFWAREIEAAQVLGVELGVVVGGGNFFRGAGLAANGMDRVTADQMGMLATVMNGLALQDALERAGLKVRVMSAIRVNQICEDYIRRRAIRHLEKGRVLVFVAGTGNPFFTTDTAATLRAIEIGAELLLKATQVDGVYSDDPQRDTGATRYTHLTFDEMLQRNLSIMDDTAVVMCRDHGMPVRVFETCLPGALTAIASGCDDIGTLVDNEGSGHVG
jgi:uridylate kinase